jgi:hypothetical protein
MIPKIASSCNPRVVHPWENPRRRKTQGGQNAALREKSVASFRGLQVSSVPFRPSGLCLVVSASETYRRSPVVFRAAAEAAKERGSLGSTRLQRSVMQRLGCGKGSEPFETRASKLGATEGPESRAADGCWSCSAAEAAKVGRGSDGLQVRMRVRVR